ncbi:MAG: hypothetical protein ACK5DD_00680 [Cyclobacteriaceae bacterium]|jgi:hypothetical protein
MSTFRVLTLFIIVLASGLPGFSQDSKTALRWQINESINLRTQEAISYVCHFISGPREIRWVQKNGTRETVFTIVSESSVWSDVSQNGRRQVVVTRGQDRGFVVFERANGQLSITLDFSESGPNAIRQKFLVTAVQPAN